MRIRKGIVAVLLALTAVGCIGLRGPDDIRRELSRESGVDLDREFGITVRRGGMWLVRWGLSFADDEDIPSLKGLHKVQVGVYETRGLRPGAESRTALGPDLFPEWETIVRVHEDGEDVMVLVQYEAERIRKMLVVVAEEDEWVLVRMKGKLDRILEDAMRMAFDEAERPDLYETAREQRGLPPEDETAALGDDVATAAYR